MKSLIIASNSSGGGKTTFTLGLMRALIKKGFNIQGYKVGPDYIDPAFHSHITNKSSRNLDLYLMGEEGVKASYSRGNGDFGIIEGVMGIYDGKGTDSKYSTAHVAKVLKLPVLLVISPKAKTTTLAAELLGIINFDSLNIAGVVFNNVSKSYYELLKNIVENKCGLKVFGYIPKTQEIALKSRHLGLVQSSEVLDLDKKIEICSELILKHINVQELIKEFKETDKFKDEFHFNNVGITTAIAYDKAFSFYYKENIELLEELGDVKYFSPLKDKEIPKNIDYLYIGGGYPEVFARELSENKTMLKSIKDNLDNNIKCYAECGGLMYLTSKIQCLNEDKFYDMVDFFKGDTFITNKLQNFGYSNISINKPNNIFSKNLNIRCHEFHKSYVELKNETIYNLEKEKYNGEIILWKDGYIKNNTLAGYPHIHFLGNIDFLIEILKLKDKIKKGGLKNK